MQPALANPFRFVLLLAVAACSSVPSGPGPRIVWEPAKSETPDTQLHLLNRVTWGANASSAQRLSALGWDRYLEQQLQPAPKLALPPTLQAQIDSMTIARPLDQLVYDVEKLRRDAQAVTDLEQKKLAQQAYQQELTRLEREAATRSLLRALYSPQQLQEQMTWFWMNHFSVFRYKGNLRAMLGDYEETIRPHALGRFRALLGASARHPAMIRYLDNEQNAANRINENYARELMELHTLGANGGYSQQDVQELARILTGVGVNLTGDMPKVRPAVQGHYVRQGLFEFNPNRHDYGDKILLGQPLKGGRGLAEVDEALDRLARHPSTARFVSRKLALFFVSDDPPAALVERMAQTFRSSDGDIAATLRTMFRSGEFTASLGRKFKDPVHYVISAVRLAYDEKPILNAAPMIGWLNRMGEPLFGRETPDGYPLTQAGWSSPGQMTTRFEIARAIGSGAAGLFKGDGPQPVERAAFPQLSNALYYQAIQKTLSPATLKALDEARSPQEWNTYLLSSPEFMNR